MRVMHIDSYVCQSPIPPKCCWFVSSNTLTRQDLAVGKLYGVLNTGHMRTFSSRLVSR